MKHLRTFIRSARTAVLVLIFWTFLYSNVWAQAAAAEAKPKSYVLGYALVFLAIGLGLAGVLRPGKRVSEVKKRS